jgi:UDP-N-acetylmuramoyl-tripeptide--D-alanyl-D-alanine ligase
METNQMRTKSGAEITVIKDCYNANPDSMDKLLSFVDKLDNGGRKLLVLADMKELGAKSKEAHEALGQKISEVKPDYTFLIGPEMKAAYEVIKNRPNVLWFEQNSEEVFDLVVKTINHAVKKNDIVVLKGSNSMKLEKVYEKICEKVCVMQEA